MTRVCIRCTQPTDDATWDCCRECRLVLAELDRARLHQDGASYRDRIARRLVEDVFA